MTHFDKVLLGIAISLMVGMALFAFTVYQENLQQTKNVDIYKYQPTDPHVGSMPHLVKFHIIPEQENLTVSIRMQMTSELVFYCTDTKSEFVAGLIPYEKYQVWVHDRDYSLYLYPVESEYYIDTTREG